MTNPMQATRKIISITDQNVVHREDQVAREYPLTIYVNDREFATMVCTQADLEEMVIGFLGSEGLIRFYKQDVASLSIDESRGFAYVSLTKELPTEWQFYSKRMIGSCCGKSRQSFYFHNDAKTAKTSTSRTTITPEQCFRLMEALQEQSVIFQQTGGVHNAALATPEQMLISRTDIGRHNALDKLYGYCLMNGVPVRDKVLLFSGRISSEVLLKAAKIGVGIMLSKSAPTELALTMAEELNVTTAGFIRDGRMNIYTVPERILTPKKEVQ
ncbi:formate dehydrogenase accessory sulfurtransferase FdhD [Halalkalibacterium halodurans]|uniref:Sulfur carrier protein FdhD n=1 Tax=Halalkalibacterium halodurans TaxID=86665 RepID=A0A0M0KIL5_ALKHA|nr:formate dehydrogenase accessory sulfurtransferase FdhD [Halalkalibacterium halodurans]MED3647032.1 formate dehydrogenase accessory sulfurtransferase FdhD [Halalkalibacterium halodurans]MED4161941.1 formate dehydrogenase accessory sulfurtransferase FdhD [Halalkalibacterium halodurans]TES50250.1 formate dehydrogenase accessory sulfurtransferase FdhD [Halalkalibacterium halodurans]TPE68149.1 formate dehydrogenase accessory sulfurtransferase FdhD [Halalkalibacterium halodurans]